MSGFNIVHFCFAACNLYIQGLKMCIKKEGWNIGITRIKMFLVAAVVTATRTTTIIIKLL